MSSSSTSRRGWSCTRPPDMPGHARQRADRPLRRQPVRDRRGEAARHRPPARQGYERAARGGQVGCRAPGLGRAVRRARARRPARAALPGLRLGRAAASSGQVDAPLARGLPTAPRWLSCAPGQGRRAVTHYKVMESMATRGPAAGGTAANSSWKPAAPTRSACIWRISAIRSWAIASMRRVLQRARGGSAQRARRSRRSDRQALHARRLGFEHPATGAPHFDSPLPRDIAGSALAALAPLASPRLPKSPSATATKTGAPRVDGTGGRRETGLHGVHYLVMRRLHTPRSSPPRDRP